MDKIPVDLLQTIMKHIKTTNCEETEVFVSAALSNKWNENTMISPDELLDYKNENWSCVEYESFHENKFQKSSICDKSCGRELTRLNNIFVDVDDIISFIENILETIKYIVINIDIHNINEETNIHEYGNGYDHCFVICNTNLGIMAIDSYLDYRNVEIRQFDYKQILTNFLTNPNVSNWNLMCKSNHENNIKKAGTQLMLEFIEL